MSIWRVGICKERRNNDFVSVKYRILFSFRQINHNPGYTQTLYESLIQFTKHQLYDSLIAVKDSKSTTELFCTIQEI